MLFRSITDAAKCGRKRPRQTSEKTLVLVVILTKNQATKNIIVVSRSPSAEKKTPISPKAEK